MKVKKLATHYGKKSTRVADIQFRRRLILYYSRFMLSLKIFLLLMVVLGLWTTKLDWAKSAISEKLIDLGGNLGLRLEKVIIDGQDNIDLNDVTSLLNADTGTPIFAIDIQQIKNKLQQNDWVKAVAVERRLPDTIYIGILERTPIAIWQINKKLYLIDKAGDIIHTDANLRKFSKLPHIVGNGANVQAQKLIIDIGSEPKLASKIVAAVRYGERRWDLILEQEVTVKMPEKDFEIAWAYLIQLFHANKLFNQNYKILDLRDQSKYYFEYN